MIPIAGKRSQPRDLPFDIFDLGKSDLGKDFLAIGSDPVHVNVLQGSTWWHKQHLQPWEARDVMGA